MKLTLTSGMAKAARRVVPSRFRAAGPRSADFQSCRRADLQSCRRAAGVQPCSRAAGPPGRKLGSRVEPLPPGRDLNLVSPESPDCRASCLHQKLGSAWARAGRLGSESVRRDRRPGGAASPGPGHPGYGGNSGHAQDDVLLRVLSIRRRRRRRRGRGRGGREDEHRVRVGVTAEGPPRAEAGAGFSDAPEESLAAAAGALRGADEAVNEARSEVDERLDQGRLQVVCHDHDGARHHLHGQPPRHRQASRA